MIVAMNSCYFFIFYTKNIIIKNYFRSTLFLLNYHIFMCVKRVNTLQRSFVKNINMNVLVQYAVNLKLYG